jgi:hypothetical protein
MFRTCSRIIARETCLPALRIRYSRSENSFEVRSILRPALSARCSTRSSFKSSTTSTDSDGKWLRRSNARMRAESSLNENGFADSRPLPYPGTGPGLPPGFAASAPAPANSAASAAHAAIHSLRPSAAVPDRELPGRSQPRCPLSVLAPHPRLRPMCSALPALPCLRKLASA